jgi:hypothetical protein
MVLFSNSQFLTLITAFSQGDDNRKGGGFGIQERERARIHAGNDSQIVNDDRFGIQERERARIHAGNDSQIVNSDLTSIILIVTIIVIIGVSSYALYKIYLIRRKSKQSKLK